MTDESSTRRLGLAIVAACPFPYPRGTPVRIYRMAEALAKRGHDVHVATYHLGDNADDEPFTTHRIARVATYRRTEAGPSWQKLLICDPLLVVKLAQVYRQHDIDVVHAHHYEGLLAALAARLLVRPARHIPIVFDAHVLLTAELHYYGMGMIKSFKQKIARKFDGGLPRRAKHVVTVTDEIRNKLIQVHGLSPDRVTALVNGVEIEHFDQPRAVRHAGVGDSTEVGGGASGNDGERTLLFTGNLAAYQGVGLMLEGFAKLRAKRQDVRLRIVTGSPFDDYEKQSRNLGIRDAIDVLPGGFDELPGHMVACDLALNPRVEGDGIAMKLLNYMAAGIPIISFAGTAKLIEHEKSGWVVADNDTQGWADAIDHLLNHPQQAEQLGVMAKNYAQEHLSWDHVATKCEEIYQQLCHAAATHGGK